MKKPVAAVLMLSIILGSSTLCYGQEYSEVSPSNGNYEAIKEMPERKTIWVYSDGQSSDWGDEAINEMFEMKIMRGYSDGSFRPYNDVTYGEFIKMAVVAGTGEDIGKSQSGDWALSYYNEALKFKYFDAVHIDKSQLSSPIIWKDMIMILSAIMDDVNKGDDNYIHKEPGIVSGYNGSSARPERTLTRLEAAVIIYNLINDSKRIPFGEEVSHK